MNKGNAAAFPLFVYKIIFLRNTIHQFTDCHILVTNPSENHIDTVVVKRINIIFGNKVRTIHIVKIHTAVGLCRQRKNIQRHDITSRIISCEFNLYISFHRQIQRQPGIHHKRRSLRGFEIKNLLLHESCMQIREV